MEISTDKIPQQCASQGAVGKDGVVWEQNVSVKIISLAQEAHVLKQIFILSAKLFNSCRFLDIWIRTIQLKHEGWGACFWANASQDVFVGNPLTILSGKGHISELVAQHSHFSEDLNPLRKWMDECSPKMGVFGYFGGTENGTWGARIKILRPLFNTNTQSGLRILIWAPKCHFRYPPGP